MATLKEVAATVKLVSQEGLGRALSELKGYIDNADTALSNRIKVIEDVNVMTSQEAKDLFDSVFNPVNA